MTDTIIEIKNIGKKYKITHERGRYVALRDVLAGVLKAPFKFLKYKIKQVAGLEKQEDFWALKDLNLTIKKGEVVGIIGRNGAGKSTLLKILSQITPPTTGEIKIRGTVGSLLEVGTGFHPELTGRENIFLNGAILGMKRSEIARKFDEIVAFAEIEKFLDTPVKYYSSGMYVRLAFSVAAHMEPDILIVDEVLAVGDAEFQKKCMGKMQDITEKKGRTILFVSHNINAIQQLCNKSILLEKGNIVMFDTTDKVVDHYLNDTKGLNAVSEFNTNHGKDVQVSKITILNKNNTPAARIPISEDFSIKLNLEVNNDVTGVIITLQFSYQGEVVLISSISDQAEKLSDFKKGDYEVIVSVPKFLFNVGHYHFDVTVDKVFVERLDIRQYIGFEIQDINNPKTAAYNGQNLGVMASILDYKVINK
ncbi:MAG: polysaccharide ABC transporter ATP-binding protein [Candidatus Pacebacteria bacterium]|jgi:lipopolysaccharide transport system ATP-binding protein|nr:polysaccharide ABC transporter ATP-binding protein [Candidatus Paceibacterota bacterium]